MTHTLLDETGFYSAIQAWTRRHTEALGETAGPLTDGLKAEWVAATGLLVVSLTYAGRPGRLFLSGWEQGIRWATDWPGALELMPAHRDPGLPLLDLGATWAAPWRDGLPADLPPLLARFVCGRWALLDWASRSRAALELLRSEPRLLWLLLMTARREAWPEQRIEASLRLKRRQVLAACGLCPSAEAVKALVRFEAPVYGVQTFALLTSWLGDAAWIKCEFSAIWKVAHPKFYPVWRFPNNLTGDDDGLAHATDNALS